MPLIIIKDADLSFSNLNILKKAMLKIDKNEKICLMGKNGAGKSTILKIINKEQDLDSGSIAYQNNLKIAYLKQENPIYLDLSIYDFISTSFFPCIFNKNSFHISKIQKEISLNKKKLKIQQIVKIEKIIKQMHFNKETLLSELSGGSLRKISLGQALVQEPDLLLLDEPTNHLDIKTVQWIESILKKITGTILFVSHDRSFIQNISTRIIDLDRGKIISWPGDYNNFVKLKKDSYRLELLHKRLFDQNLEKEEEWIRKGIKARCTRNEGRVKKLHLLRNTQENYQKIEKIQNININQIKNHSGKIVFKLENIHFLINQKKIIQNFSAIVQNGDKIGLIGDNGCGKSTLIKIIIGKKIPKHGKIYPGTGLKIAYFDQNRLILNPEKSILENMDCGTEKIIFNGKTQHLISYLKDFLFQPNQMHTLVKTLSGGESNRLLLARLFLKPSNVLILDEPTNDLDLDTLQLLEQVIINYQGTILIVSHDRKFIENTVNQYWKFEKNGHISIFLGKYNSHIEEKNNIRIYHSNKKKIYPRDKKNYKPKKLSKKNNQRQINQTLQIIEKLELEIIVLQNKLNTPFFFQKNIEEKLPVLKLLSEKEKELQEQLKNWETLEK